ncbi:MAG: beta strand repeat-containing protein [Candidatus Dormibacterales bacterium]
MSPSRRRPVGFGAGVSLVAFAFLASPQAADAATPIACSTPALVAAVASVAGGGTLTLTAACTYTVTAANNSADEGTGLPVITGVVTIAGNGATIARSTAAGTPAFRLFDVASSGSLTVDSLTLSNGLLSNSGTVGGAGIYNHGTLSVSNSTFSGNQSPSPNGVSGGAISNSGNLTVTTSVFSNNLAQEGASIFNQNMATVSQTTFANNNGYIYGGGGILNAYGTTNVSSSTFVGNTGGGGGAIDNDTTMTVTNSTFYNNTGVSSGGGAVNNFGTMTFIQSTFSGNTASTGADIHNYSYGSVTATTTLIMSIIANGVGSENCNSNGPPIIDGGYNLDSGSSCGFTAAQHSLNNSAPQLGALASNGGVTQTMALPVTSPAANAIPTSVSGCSGSTDQRGISRPQGTGCDIGAFELVPINDSIPPTVPTGLVAPSVTASAVALQWNASTDDTAVTGYTVYRNGASVGSTVGATATTYSDASVAASTTYSYTVDAVDSAALHSAQSAALPVTTQAGPPPPPPPPPGIRFVQAGVVGTGSKVASTTLPLTAAVHLGDLLVGWFGQYDSAGLVQVSDNVNGAWIRGASSKWSSGAGDLALFYVQNAAAAPNGVTITISSSAGTYLEGAAGDYSGVAPTGALDSAAIAMGNSAVVDSGATAAAAGGELVVGGIITGGSPGSITAGASQSQPFTMRAQKPSGSVDIEDILSSAPGAQNARATFGSATDWYAMAATFHPYANADTQPPTVPTGLVAAASSTAPLVTLSWNASTDNVAVAGYTVYRNSTKLATVTAPALSFVDNTVTSVTAYSYTVDAYDAAGNHSAQSSSVSITTPDTTPPSVPAGVAAKAVSPGEVDVSWNASTDNVGVTGYTVYRNGVVLTTTGGTVASWADKTVAASTTYTYSVDAFDAAGNHSAQSSPISATTPATPDTQPPTVPAGVVAQVGPVGEVDLRWNASTDNVGVTGYTVYRNGVSLSAVSGTTLTYADRSVVGVTSYSFTVDAFDAAGNHSAQSLASNVTTPDWTPPTTPTGLAANVASSSEIDLTWNPSTDNVGVAGYTVYRNGLMIGTTAASPLSYANTGLGHGFSYTYRVDAFDAAGNHSAQSTTVTAATHDDIPPTTPGSVTATAASATSVNVSWSASTDNVGVAGYDVIRDGTSLISLGAAVLTYNDLVTSGSTHTYAVDALDAAGNHSIASAPISVTTPAGDTIPPSVPAGLAATASGSTSIALAWNASTDNVGVTGYTVYRNGAVLSTAGGTTLAFTDATVVAGTTYTYTVDAFDAAGNHSAQSAPASASTHVAGVPKYVQSAVVATGSRVTTVTLKFGPVAQGDLLIGWFGQYDSPGQVGVSDSVNGSWTRSSSTTWRGSPTAPGDIALYYRPSSAAAPAGLTITITSTGATYLQGGAGEYSGVATVNPLDQVVVAKGSSATADSGLTAAVGSGELVFGGMTATSGPGTLTPGSSQGVSFAKRIQNSSGSQGVEDISSSAAGQQHTVFSFPTSTQWFVVCAVLRAA